MKLSVYLLRDNFRELNDFLREKYREGREGLDELEPSEALPYESRTFLLKSGREYPRWASYFSSHFMISDLEVANYSFVHILRSSNRIFAFTFGYGHTMLDPARMEPNFGLRVCANSIDPKRLTTLDVRNIDVVTKQQRTHLSTATNVLDFGIELEEEWIRFLSGVPLDSSIAKSIAGADSLKIRADVNLEELAIKCSDILALYDSDRYKDNFAYLDHYRAVGKNDPVIAQLESELERRIIAQSTDKISIASPEIPDEQNIERYKIHIGISQYEFPELKLEEVYHFLSSNPDIENPLNKVHIIPLDQDDNPCAKASTLRDYLVCEAALAGDIYVLSAGVWFRVSSPYAQTIREKARQIEDLTTELALVPLINGESEESYNERLSSVRNWVKLDRRLINLQEPYQRVEVCDVFADNNRFLCIKKMTRSSTLSHLFAQAAVSAELLRGDDYYKSQVRSQINERLGRSINIDDPTPTFVISFVTEKPGPLWETIFLFSAIHLVRQVQLIRRLGFGVAIAKINIQ